MISQQRRFSTYYETTNQFIGQGSFAQVFLAKRRSSGELVAVKITNKNSAISLKEKEILTQLSKFSHPQVVSILDIFDEGLQFYIVQEYCIGGTLYDQMLQYSPMPEEQTVDIILQISEGLSFLHSINIVHRDIKPENVLKQVGKDGKELYKITDFGLSSNREKVMTSKIGTAYYVAPEIVDGRAEREGYDKSVDIWALGLMFDELLHGQPFYNGTTEDEVFIKVRNEPYYVRNEKYRTASYFDSTKFIIQQVLVNTIVKDPSRRKDLSWVVDQLTTYKQAKRKSEPKKTNKQILMENETVIQEDLLDFLSGGTQYQVENEQRFQHVVEPVRIVPPQKVQQIHQKYSNLQNPNNISQLSQTPPLPTKNIWDTLDQAVEVPLCREHSLPLNHRMPLKGESQIVPACLKCLQIMGVYELDVLQRTIDEALQILMTKRFEYFYKTSDVITRAKQLSEKLRLGDLEIRESGALLQQYHQICESYETEARSIFGSRVLSLEKFKARSFTSDDLWILDCMMGRRNDENIFLLGIRRQMNEIQEKALFDCKSLMDQYLIRMVEQLKKKLEG